MAVVELASGTVKDKAAPGSQFTYVARTTTSGTPMTAVYGL